MKTMSELKMNQKETYRQSSPSGGKIKEQQALFTEEILKNKPSDFDQRLGNLFDTVRSKYSSLFSDEYLKLKPLTLAYIVGRLQYISLTRTPGDVKGEAFQAFVYRHQRGDRGEFFTPHPVVRLAVVMIAPKPN